VAQRAHRSRRQLRSGSNRARAGRWDALAYELIGAGFGALGVAFIAFAFIRQRRVEEALRTGGYAALDDRIALALTIVGSLLGVGTILIVIVQT
jgi:hypothetical protein